MLAGGVESASTAPWRFWPPAGDAEPVRYERAPFAPAADRRPRHGAGRRRPRAEHGISRPAQDEYAARSHARAIATVQAGGFDAGDRAGRRASTRDDRPRAGLTVERLARLRPAFGPGGTATAGNSCGINDGAAVGGRSPMPRRTAGSGVPGPPRARHRDRRRSIPTASGCRWSRPTRLALDRAGLTLDDIDVVELNEAFAGQILACCAELGLDPERVCPQGGALALGHPWGASGAVLAVRLFTQLVRQRAGRYGLAAIAPVAARASRWSSRRSTDQTVRGTGRSAPVGAPRSAASSSDTGRTASPTRISPSANTAALIPPRRPSP